MNLNKINYAYSRHGFIGAINTILGKFGIKFRFITPLEKMIIYLGNRIETLTKNRILSGIYKNTHLEINKNWNSQDTSAKFLGIYEKEVQNEISRIQSKSSRKKKYFINLGAGEGFHIVGCLKNKLFKNGLAFESDLEAQKYLKINCKKNNIKSINIYGLADGNFLKENYFKEINLKDCFFLIDIEGGEFTILNNENLKKLRKSILIIEIHDFYKSPKKLVNNLKKYFNINFISTGERDLSKFTILDNFHDNEKWLLANEGRPKKMYWISCLPKK